MKVDIEWPRKGWRRKQIKIHDYDTWSADTTLAMIIAPLLRAFIEKKEKMPGVPASFCPYKEDESDEENEKRMEEATKEWNGVLGKMLWAMEEIASFERHRPDSKRPKHIPRREWNNAFFTGKHKEERHKAFREAMEPEREYRRKIQEGCDLLGKYFQNLWW